MNFMGLMTDTGRVIFEILLAENQGPTICDVGMGSSVN
jgi:hypothetical protein